MCKLLHITLILYRLLRHCQLAIPDSADLDNGTPGNGLIQIPFEATAEFDVVPVPRLGNRHGVAVQVDSTVHANEIGAQEELHNHAVRLSNRDAGWISLAGFDLLQ